MAKFDVHKRLNGPGYLLDLQANILSGLNTRFVAPLLPRRMRRNRLYASIRSSRSWASVA